jgi:amino acid transporter
VVEEIKDSNRTLPRAILLGLSGVIAIYTCVNVAYFTLLSPKDMMASSAVAFSFVEVHFHCCFHIFV